MFKPLDWTISLMTDSSTIVYHKYVQILKEAPKRFL